MHCIFIGRSTEHPENASFAWNNKTFRRMLNSNNHLWYYFCEFSKQGMGTGLTKYQVSCIEEGISSLEPQLLLTDQQKVRISAWEKMNCFPKAWEKDIFGPLNKHLATYILFRWLRYHHQKWQGDELARVCVSDK